MFNEYSYILQNNIYCSMLAFLLSLILIFIDGKISRENRKAKHTIKISLMVSILVYIFLNITKMNGSMVGGSANINIGTLPTGENIICTQPDW
jgi:hypothetical protein